MDNKEYNLSSKDVSRMFGVHTVQVWRWRQAGLPHIKIGARRYRYNHQDILDFLKNNFGEPSVFGRNESE